MVGFLRERLEIERKKKDRSGIYGFTQRMFAYHSNRIEGNALTEAQTESLFDRRTLPKSDDYYRAKDVEEMNGHFLMFNRMLETMEEPLTQELIKRFHYELKSGVFEDRANGSAIGDYKERPNRIGLYETVCPEQVEGEMEKLLEWYEKQEISLRTLVEFHARYEAIHPFQDGNGRTGCLLLFRECLRGGLCPAVIEDRRREEYINALKGYREEQSTNGLLALLKKEQEFYYEKCRYFMPAKQAEKVKKGVDRSDGI